MKFDLRNTLEFDGLTVEMVVAWIERNGWVRDAYTANNATPGWCRGHEWVFVPKDLKRGNLQFLNNLALAHKLHPQMLLRQMNPGMQPGWPSDKELSRHEYWLVRRDYETPVVARYMDNGGGVFVRAENSNYDVVYKKDAGSGWNFCPCDIQGQKVPRSLVSWDS